MHHAFLDEGRIMMGRGPAGFGATSLIDRNIHQDTARAASGGAFRDGSASGLRAGDQNGADQQIDIRQQIHQMRFA